MTEIENNSGASAAVGLPSGTRLGKYEILGRMAIGGQAIVYKGFDTMLDRHVAIKQISSHLASDPRFLERFRREAQILARLGGKHANIVNVYDFIEQPTGLYIVMEFVDGHTLSAVLEHQRHALPVQPALEILWHIANGLKFAHSQGIVHRDIKPGNVIVTRQHQAKLMDFGVAAQKGGQESLAMGTTKYMAPELFEGGTVDARADIYSLGFIAYEMFTGREFFNTLFADVVRDPQSENLRWMKWHSNMTLTVPPLAQVNAKIPPALSAIIEKMMEKDPSRRYASMEEVIADLQGAVAKHKDLKHAKAAAAAAALAAAAGGTAGRSAGPLDSSGSSLSLPSQEGGGEDLPTAPIPRKAMSSRTKMIIGVSAGSVALLGMLVLIFTMVISHSTRQKKATVAFQNAREMFMTGEFDRARQAFEQIANQYADLREGTAARARMYMAQAHLAMRDNNWEQAEKYSDQARSMNTIEEQEIRAFKNELSTRRQASQLLEKALAAINDKAFDNAEEYLTQLADLRGLPIDLNEQGEQVRKQMDDAKQRDHFDQLLQSGDEAVAAGDFETAQKKYDEAKKLFDNDQTDLRFRRLTTAQKYAEAMAKFKAAQGANDLKGQLEALMEAAQVQPSEDLANQIKALQAEEAYQRGMAAIQANDFETARKAFVDSVAAYPTDKAKKALDDLQNQQQRQAKIAQGDQFMAEQKFDDAIGVYEQALPGDDVQAKLTEAKYQKYVAAGDKAMQDKKWDEASAAYEQARAIKADPETSSAIDAKLETLGQHKKYFDLLDRAEVDLKAGKYPASADKFRQAQKLVQGLSLPQDYAGIRVKQVLYEEQVAKGKDAMTAANYSFAKACFIQAKKSMETAEINELIAQAQAAADKNPAGQP